jgi:hypothetical protein
MRRAFAGPGWAREPKRDRQKAAGPSPLIEQDIGSTGGSGPRGAMRRNPDSPVSAPRSENKSQPTHSPGPERSTVSLINQTCS